MNADWLIVGVDDSPIRLEVPDDGLNWPTEFSQSGVNLLRAEGRGLLERYARRETRLYLDLGVVGGGDDSKRRQYRAVFEFPADLVGDEVLKLDIAPTQVELGNVEARPEDVNEAVLVHPDQLVRM